MSQLKKNMNITDRQTDYIYVGTDYMITKLVTGARMTTNETATWYDIWPEWVKSGRVHGFGGS